MKIELAEPKLPKHGTLVVFVGKDGTFSKSAQQIDAMTDGLIRRAVDCTGKAAKQLSGVTHLLLPGGLTYDHLLIAFAPANGSSKPREFEELGGHMASKLSQERVLDVSIAGFDGLKLSISEKRAIEACATGLILKSYRFDRYNAKSQEEDGEIASPRLETIRLLVQNSSDTDLVSRLEAMSSAVFHTRDLVSEPGNVLYPKSFAEECRKLEPLGIEVEILDAEDMKKLGMGAILGVGQGSAHPPYLVVMRWVNNGDEAPLALVGKGVCFDTGGISIKPSGGMEDMKFDMGGAGAVFGAMKALASRKAKTNVVGVLGLAENMPSDKAQRPGDVVRAMSGKTIEVINTDAEGRLVLADALHYTISRFKPKAVIDLATLTGAVIVALGHEHAGLFSNDDTLANRIIEAGEEIGETVWRLPLGKNYEKHIKSQIAEIKNVGRAREAGSTAGAVFLQQFVGKCLWAHLDIAGVAWTKINLATVPLGATGFGVRLLDRLVAKHFEA